MGDEERLGNMWLRNGQEIRQGIRQELKSGAWAQSKRRAREKQPIFCAIGRPNVSVFLFAPAYIFVG
jgi:hypothetical protein